MALPSPPAGVRRHLFPDELYGETPELPLADTKLAARAARLLVKLSVDGHGPQAGAASPADIAAGILRLGIMEHAAVSAGFAANVRLAQPDGGGAIRAHYSFTPETVDLIVADRPPGTSGRTFSLQWVLGEEGPQPPQVPSYVKDKAAYLNDCARAYGRLLSAVSGGGPGPTLDVVSAGLVPYSRKPAAPPTFDLE